MKVKLIIGLAVFVGLIAFLYWQQNVEKVDIGLSEDLFDSGTVEVKATDEIFSGYISEDNVKNNSFFYIDTRPQIDSDNDGNFLNDKELIIVVNDKQLKDDFYINKKLGDYFIGKVDWVQVKKEHGDYYYILREFVE